MSELNIREVLLKRAGIEMHNHQPNLIIESDLLHIVEALLDIHRIKGQVYGDYVRNKFQEGKDTALFAHFIDIQRKFMRAKNINIMLMKGQHHDRDDLFDTYSDLAVYSILGILLIKALIEEDN